MFFSFLFFLFLKLLKQTSCAAVPGNRRPVTEGTDLQANPRSLRESTSTRVSLINDTLKIRGVIVVKGLGISLSAMDKTKKERLGAGFIMMEEANAANAR